MGTLGPGDAREYPTWPRELAEVARSLTDRSQWRDDRAAFQEGVSEALELVAPLLDTMVGERVAAQTSLVLHELRTPMAVLTMALGTLQDNRMALAEDQREELLRTAFRHAKNLGDLLEQVKPSRELEGDFEITTEALDVAQTLTEVLRDLAALSSHHTIVPQLDADVPQALADGQSLRRILVALLGNALTYSPPSTAIEVTLGSDDGGSVTIAVTNGLHQGSEPPTAIVFERGHRGQPEADQSGLGLGLFLARGLARAMGGDLDVAASDKAATFVVRLPAFAP